MFYVKLERFKFEVRSITGNFVSGVIPKASALKIDVESENHVLKLSINKIVSFQRNQQYVRIKVLLYYCKHNVNNVNHIFNN